MGLLNEVRAIVNLPKVDGDPIPGLADAVRAAVQQSAARTDAPKLPSADQLAAIVNRYEAWRLARHGLASFAILSSAAAQDRADLLSLAKVLAESLDWDGSCRMADYDSGDYCQVCGAELPSDHGCPDILATLRRVVST